MHRKQNCQVWRRFRQPTKAVLNRYPRILYYTSNARVEFASPCEIGKAPNLTMHTTTASKNDIRYNSLKGHRHRNMNISIQSATLVKWWRLIIQYWKKINKRNLWLPILLDILDVIG